MMKGAAVMAAAVVLAFAAAAAAAADEHVIDLTSENFDEAIAKHPLIMVEFYAPWCGHCKALAPEYEKAATEAAAANAPYKFAKVNADEEPNRPLAQRFGVRGFPTLKVIRNGNADGAADYQGERKAEALVSFMKKQSLPAVTVLADAAAVEAFAKEDRVVLVLFADAESEHAAAFAKVADSLRDKFLFGRAPAAAAAASGAAAQQVVLFKQFDEGKNVYTETSLDGLAAFITKHSIPLIDEIGPNNYRDYVESGLPLAYLFVDLKVDGQKDAYVERVRATAEAGKGKINFVYIDWSKYAKHSERLGLSGTVVPALAIEHEGRHFAYDEKADLSAELIKKWIEQYLAGEVAATVKSEEIPADNSGPVKVIVAKQFDELVLNADKHVLLEFYAPWCGHCKALAPVYEELGASFAGTNVVIAKIDATANDVDPKYGVRGFPTIKLFKIGAKGEPSEYQGDRSLADLQKYIQTETSVAPTVAAAPAAAGGDEKDEL